MPRITFTRDYREKAEGGKSYRKGQTVEVNEASARHFLNRGAAEGVSSSREADEEGDKDEKGKASGKDNATDDLSAKTVVELHDVARSEGVQGFSGMHKDELVKAIQSGRKGKK